MTPIKIGIAGAAGRMGKMLISEVVRTNAATLSAATVMQNDPARGMDAGECAGVGRLGILLKSSAVDMFEGSDVVIDFTSPSASLEHCLLANEYKTALVIGTTGFNPAQKQMLIDHARKVPIVAAPNMSLGVNVLQAITRAVAKILDDSFDIEIIERHHRHKVDSPSGTALSLGFEAAQARGIDVENNQILSRAGQTGERPRGHIGYAVTRGGDVIGDHTVLFAGDGECIELRHLASSRQIYAKGAVKAALWLKDKPAGLYSMKDVLGLPF
jgi:4-hydroxy-tetrahydrodipicolinate reductase